MQEANYTSLLKTLFWIVAVYYIVRFLARIFLPILAKKAVEKVGEQFQKQQQQYQNQQQETTTKTNFDKPRETNKVGEYIDYEEI